MPRPILEALPHLRPPTPEPCLLLERTPAVNPDCHSRFFARGTPISFSVNRKSSPRAYYDDGVSSAHSRSLETMEVGTGTPTMRTSLDRNSGSQETQSGDHHDYWSQM